MSAALLFSYDGRQVTARYRALPKLLSELVLLVAMGKYVVEWHVYHIVAIMAIKDRLIYYIFVGQVRVFQYF